jgi:iron complex outermembrane recepter protein
MRETRALRCFLLALFVQATGVDASPGPGQPDATQTLKGLSIEALSKIDVTSVSKHAESISEAAAAISVITADELRRAGVTELPEAMRLATGMSVARFNSETWGISARGFNISTANKMLVLIDGRSVYTPLFSGVFWGVQDAMLADVERIEVIRGPGATLWGANAVNGVINIITKPAADTQGGILDLRGGTQQRQAAVRYGGSAGRAATYRVYGKYSFLDAQVFSDGSDADDQSNHGQGGFRLEWATSPRTTATLQGDVYDARNGLADRADIEESGGNFLGRVNHTALSGGQVQVQAYYDRTYRNVPRQFSEHRGTYDVEAQYRFPLAGRHDLTTGLGYRVTSGDAPPSPVLFFEPAERTSHLVNTFVQDSIALSPNKVVVTVGSKFEHNDFTGFEFQPTARLRWSPTSAHTVWGAVSRAVRMPTRFDADLRFTGAFPVVVLQGDRDFKSETVIATELGYRVRFGNAAAMDVAAFVNEYDRLRTQEAPPPPQRIPVTLGNTMEATTQGVEIAVDLQPLSRVQVRGAYAYLKENFTFKPGSRDVSGGTSEHNDPAQQFLFRASLDVSRSAEIDVVFRAISALPNPAVPRYSELTLRAGWGRDGPVEFSLIGDNLLHPQHGEAAATGPLQEQFRRRAIARLTWRF